MQSDLFTLTGLSEAVAGVDVVVHSATTLNGAKDVQGTRNLLAEARQAGVKHLLDPRIVGIDALGFYDDSAGKLACEALIQAGGLPTAFSGPPSFTTLFIPCYAA